MTAWKRTERAVAATLGGRRVPVSGRGRGDAPDVAHPVLSVEVKHRRSLPGWLTDAMAQAEAAADGRLPVAVLHSHGERHADALAVLRLRDLAALLDAARAPPAAPDPTDPTVEPTKEPRP